MHGVLNEVYLQNILHGMVRPGLRGHVWSGHAVISASTYPQTLMREIIVGQPGRLAKAAAQRQQELQFCSVATGENTGGFLSSNCCSLLPLTDLSSLPL